MRCMRAVVVFAMAFSALGAAHAQQPRAQPLVVEVCGKPVTYTRVPQRAVTHDVNITEMFLYLGLGSKLVGYSGISAARSKNLRMPEGRMALAAGAISLS